MKTEKMKDNEEAEGLKYHLEVCDMPKEECPIKMAYYKKYGDFGEYPMSD